MRIAAQLLVEGVVQGVGFRAWTQKHARMLGLHGFVRNLADGRVEVFVQGDQQAVDTLVDRCRRGPPGSEVTELKVIAKTSRPLEAFVIEKSALDPGP